MKNLAFVFIMLWTMCVLSAQHQLDIRGLDYSTETVANIRVSYVGDEDVVGLNVVSTPHANFGNSWTFFRIICWTKG